MPACPHREQPKRLARLLSGEMAEDEQTRLMAHLENCPDCRHTLDSMAARSGLWSDLSLLREDPAGASSSEAPTGVEDAHSDDVDDDEIPLGLFEPTDRPDLLGTLGPYDIVRVIGRGGMGVVFLGRDRALDRLVAIKLLTPGMAATAAARRRFGREAKAAAAVAHEHVVTIHAVDATPQGIPYLVMQYIPGKSVQDLIDQKRQPELREILRIGSQTARGLAAAHDQGLIHRDIKPANILLENGVERVKLTDFGLARAIDDATTTQSGVVAGTPQYMSPEQARGDSIDHRTDLLSLGSVLYALCTGIAPFRGRSSMATLKRVCEDVPAAITGYNPDIPPWLVAIIDRLHAKDPARRYATAEEVADLLGRCLAHVQQPESVPLPSELVSPPRRKQFAVATLAGIALLVVAALALTNVRAAAADAARYLATVLRLATPEGVLIVETDDPGIGIVLDGSEMVVTGAGVKELRLAVGKHSVHAMKDGKVIRDELVTITRNGQTILKVRREPEAPPTAAAATIPPTPMRAELVAKPLSNSNKRAAIDPMERRPGSLPAPVDEHLCGSEVRSIAFRPDGGTIAYGLKDGRIGIWDWHSRVQTGADVARNLAPGSSMPMMGRFVKEKPQTTMLAHAGGVESVAFSSDGETLLTGGWDHHVKLWRLSENPPTSVWDFGGFSDGVRSVAFSPSGEYVAAGGFDRILVVLDTATGLRVWTSPVLEQPINGVQFSHQGGMIALALGDYSKGVPGNLKGQPGEVQLWSWPGRSKLASFSGWTRECKTVVFSPDDATLAATCGDGTTRLYDVTKKKEIAVLKSGPFTAGAAFSPDGMELATSNWSGDVRLWNHPKAWKASTNSLRLSFQAGQSNVPCLAYFPAPDGRILATGSADGTIKLWDTARIGGTAAADAQSAHQLAEALKSHPPAPGSTRSGQLMQVYMRDLVDGSTTLIADEPEPGMARVSSPCWSRDGRKIAFHASPTNNGWNGSRMYEVRDVAGKPTIRSLGAGNCPAYSPDGRQIAYLVWGDSVWIKDENGSNPRRLGIDGAPYWSPSGDKLMINEFNFTGPSQCHILDVATGKDELVRLAGLELFSWSRWIDQNTIVSVIKNKEEMSIVTLDIHQPSNARIVSPLWERSREIDLTPRWPLPRPTTGQYFFVGVEEGDRRNLYSIEPGVNGTPMPLLPLANVDRMGGLFFSPGGRYLLINANWPEQH